MDKRLARALNIRLGKYANESTKNEKTVFGAKPIPAELKKKKRTDEVPRFQFGALLLYDRANRTDLQGSFSAITTWFCEIESNAFGGTIRRI
uniref:Uncharacterized protein n=1 Tax=Paenibacillus polymyxa TaxID=1406 RepID=A0AAE9PR57_PAEPO